MTRSIGEDRLDPSSRVLRFRTAMDTIRRSVDSARDVVRSRRDSAASESESIEPPARRSSLKGSRRSSAEVSPAASAYRPGLDRIESASAAAPAPTASSLSSSALALQSIDTTAGPSRELLHCEPGSRGHSLDDASRMIKPGEAVTYETTVLKPSVGAVLDSSS